MLNLKGPSLGISGRFKLDVLNSKGELVEDKCLPEQKNLITENGLKQVLSGMGNQYGHVRLILGTGSTPPQREDVRLDNALVAAPQTVRFYQDALLHSDSSFEISKSVTFNLGQVVGNITELGLAYPYSNLSNYTLMTRALIKDASGDATSIEILADEQLIVTYTLQLDVSESDEPYTFSVIKDDVLEDHTVTPLFKIKHGAQSLGIMMGSANPSHYSVSAVIEENLSAYSEADSMVITGTYSPDRKTYTSEFKAYAGISKWNGSIKWVGVCDYIFPGSTATFRINNDDISNPVPSSGTTFIWKIDPPITKTDEQVMEMTCSVSVTYGD